MIAATLIEGDGIGPEVVGAAVRAIARDLAGMDASMRQKVALTAAHLLCEGRVADMGMGSGPLAAHLRVVALRASHALAGRTSTG